MANNNGQNSDRERWVESQLDATRLQLTVVEGDIKHAQQHMYAALQSHNNLVNFWRGGASAPYIGSGKASG